MSDKPVNFNLQGSISFGEKKEPPKNGDKSTRPSNLETWARILEALKGILSILVLIFFYYIPSLFGTCEQSSKKQLPPEGAESAISLSEYTVSVGSFADLKQAEVLAAKLREGRINNFIVQSKGKWHVCVGKYWSVDRANRVKEDLVERGYEGATVLSPQKK